MVERSNMTCRVCKKRSNFYVGRDVLFRNRKFNVKVVREIFVRCPKCLKGSWLRYKRHG